MPDEGVEILCALYADRKPKERSEAEIEEILKPIPRKEGEDGGGKKTIVVSVGQKAEERKAAIENFLDSNAEHLIFVERIEREKMADPLADPLYDQELDEREEEDDPKDNL